MLYVTHFILALVTTWVIEILISIVVLRFVFHDQNLPIGKIIFTGALCTALTLPYLRFVLQPYTDPVYYPLIGESFVVIVEAVILNRVLDIRMKQAVMCSLAMDSASYVLGFYLL